MDDKSKWAEKVNRKGIKSNKKNTFEVQGKAKHFAIQINLNSGFYKY
jgi:hypothetical protein